MLTVPILSAVATIGDHFLLPDPIFIEELSQRIGKSEKTIRTYAQKKEYAHLIPQPVRRFIGSRRLHWLPEDVLAWMNLNQPACPPPPRRPRGRPSKVEQLARQRWADAEGAKP